MSGERPTGQRATERSRKLTVHEARKESGWGLRADAGGPGGRWILRRTGEAGLIVVR